MRPALVMSQKPAHFAAALLIWACAAFCSGSLHAATEEIRTIDSVGLRNDAVQVLFDLKTGAMNSMKNLATGDEYLKRPGREGNPFRVWLNTTETPRVLLSDQVGDAPGSLGGMLIDPEVCQLTQASFERTAQGGTLHLCLKHTPSELDFQLRVSLPDEDIALEMALEIHNAGGTTREMLAAAPFFSGLGLGADPDTNLGVRLLGFGQSRAQAWANSGSIYGWQWGGQWNAVYEPSAGVGLGLIVKDTSMRDKALCRHPGGVMYALYPTKETLQPGAALAFPPFELLVYSGDWKPVARRYGNWFRSAYTLRRQPRWLDEVDLFVGNWIPDPKTVRENQQAENADRLFGHFKQLPLLFLGSNHDLMEWAQYWQGVIRHDIYDSYNHTDGVYDFRGDLGGIKAFGEGGAAVEKLGRHAGLYIAARSVRADSLFFSKGYPGEGTRAEDWMIMTTPETTFQSTNARGDKTAHMCFRYGPWQDHLAATIGGALRESGCRYVRIDEFGSTWEPCWNPRHGHVSPFNAMPETMEFLRKIRLAIDAVNPEILLFTEDATDMLALYCDGTLNLWAPGPDISPVRLVMPEFTGLSYHLGEVDCALQGFIPGFPTACNRDGWWNPHHGKIWSPGLEKAPANYPLPGPALRWHELGHSFVEAVRHGTPTDINPAAEVSDSGQWAGRLWKSERYWLMTCGDRAAIRPEKPVRVRIPELPEQVTHAFEFDVETLAMRDADLERGMDGVYVTTTAGFSAVLLPLPDCPPLIEAILPTQLERNAALPIALSSFAPWQTEGQPHTIVADISGVLPAPQELTLPATISVSIPAPVLPGQYKLLVKGDCLPFKRWLTVKE